MSRRIRRFPEYELTLTIHDDSFIRPPRESQRNWVLNRSLSEFVDELGHLNRIAPRFISGGDSSLVDDRTQSQLDPQEIMEDWQIPVMKAMAKIAAEQHGDVIEIGFGRGVSATFLQQQGVRSHTIVECNDTIVDDYHQWRRQFPDRDIRLLHGKWQDVIPAEQRYDAVFFHTYPLTPEEHAELVVKSLTFASHFFPVAARHLRPGGVFTYLTNESDSLSRGHQRLLWQHFSEIRQQVVGPLNVPFGSRDATWTDTMVVVGAYKEASS